MNELPGGEIAYAKINLALHVRAREADGYHRIETLFFFARDGDLLRATEADTLSLAITGPFAGALADEKDNLVLRAAEAMRQAFGIRRGAALTLDKRLPVASGIGGGSADAAAALRLLAGLWSIEPFDARLGDIARSLGADVPACLASIPMRGEGRGERLTPVSSGRLAGMPLLLVNPGVAVPTGPVFKAWDGKDRGSLGEGDPLTIAKAGRNDLETPACALVPVIATVIDSLRACPGVLLARMSGSGATCFALFENESDRSLAAESIRRRTPDWWCLETELR